jgi:hypothetical protein
MTLSLTRGVDRHAAAPPREAGWHAGELAAEWEPRYPAIIFPTTLHGEQGGGRKNGRWIRGRGGGVRKNGNYAPSCARHCVNSAELSLTKVPRGTVRPQSYTRSVAVFESANPSVMSVARPPVQTSLSAWSKCVTSIEYFETIAVKAAMRAGSDVLCDDSTNPLTAFDWPYWMLMIGVSAGR